ncbi:hypothetical protein SAMN05518871_103311 [Psychrobacillus sp. OK028]|uniref:hypothetical protein n=1 Tax=Psychrobacillus sp. OK028 TaxID=1884359 RepID=UPI00088D04DD|nr:hypothetical protein [Psychrobacillus sp. OK028]SDN10726.1 hypothetical protein SAMN05518871_103311 [Psychrobacillus sp. OK028]
MAKSAAKRKRDHLLRNIGKDVTVARNEVNFSTHVRMTKSKKEKLQQHYTKYKKHFTKGTIPDGNAFYYDIATLDA